MKLRLSASVFMIAAGLIHLVIAPLHWAHAPAHGLFFALSGVAEVAWGIAFWRKPTTTMQAIGVVMAGGLIALWIITRLLPAPFGDEPGEIELTGIVSKLLEGLALIALVAQPVSGTPSGEVKIPDWLRVGRFVAVGLMAGIFVYQIAILAEPMFPWLGEQSIPIAAASVETPITIVESTKSSTPDDLQLVVAGFASPFANGDEVPVASEVIARLIFMPGEERYGRELDVYLYRQDTSLPIDDAALQATARMRFMDHGTFRPIAYPTGEGHYLLLLQFPMPGEWQVELEITAAGAQNTIYLDLDLFE